MKRVIVAYEKITKEILDLLIDTYPLGYDFDDIISFKNARGETIKALEVNAPTTIYLIKISTKLEEVMEFYSEDEYFFEDNKDFDINLTEEDS